MNVSRSNFRYLLDTFLSKDRISTRQVAKAIGCSELTLRRILHDKTWASDKMLKQGALLMEIGFPKYSKLSKFDRSHFEEIIGTITGGSIGIGSIPLAISAMGLAGLSGAGITSGLAAIGALLGGGMVIGISALCALPFTVASIGYGLGKAIKYARSEQHLNAKAIDVEWELPQNWLT